MSYQRHIDRFLNLYYTLKFKPQCIHVHFGFNALDWIPIKQVLGQQIRLMVSFLGRDLTVDPKEDPTMYQELFEMGDIFVASSPYLRDLAIYYGCSPEKIHVHPVEIDTEFLHPPLTPIGTKDKPLIVTVARLVWEKDYETALKAMARLKQLIPDRPFEYVIIGDGPLEQSLKQLAKSLQLEDTVIFLGKQSQIKTRELLWQADVFLLTSVSEGLGSSVLEAQSCGVPVVATRVGGLPYAIKENETGILVEAKADESIAQALCQILHNPTIREQMGNQARQYIETTFSANILYPKLLEYYQIEQPQAVRESSALLQK